ncbi:MAG: excinuclease ABC subunit UvrC [Candidatus Margulisbacteria bacterium]|nr:excinuclease ABC subunit UvrC [Candidatus Margulisiibacteriota bacterium]MBU1021944.1 excinuclease ABC subunit UvrC [Candidatus Margulisiibacteriota bacterium]MBU1728923.1 excinuclease ABC subunit UvrC [Candidatus Margulisiibacteriota bacterium]MBU1954729.1 excinuclease ABC subunit UvrC [Candidatus Margulisiibacteriota bacterium]
MSFIDQALKEKARSLPRKSGVYLFKNSADRVIYVGKAKNLRNRVAAYFRANETDPKLVGIQHNAKALDFIVTTNETECIFLEATLIKKYRPRYNVILRDDKRYPYLKLTMQEAWPRLIMVRKVEKDGAKYFGPFEGSVVRKTIRLVKRVFPIRWCKSLPLKKRKEPCLNYHMHRCLGPCVGKVSHAEYLDLCKGIITLLSGRVDKIIDKTKTKMQTASQNKKYEKAASLRDNLRTLEKISEKQKAVLPRPKDIDVFVCDTQETGYVVLVLKVRQGKLIDKEVYRPKQYTSHELEEALRQFLLQYYSSSLDLPAEIVVQFDFEERGSLENALSKTRKVKFVIPKRGDNLHLLQLAEENLRFIARKKGLDVGSLKELQEVLKMDKLPGRIEAFDVSNLQGTNMVASMVAFEGGNPQKEHYRKFKIRTLEGPNDVGAVYEVVYRRYAKTLAKKLPLPDLILIDGGIGQLRAARSALVQAGRSDTKVISLAKKEEEIYTLESSVPLRLARDSLSLRLLQRVRDEAHRFAITYHRGKRNLFA